MTREWTEGVEEDTIRYCVINKLLFDFSKFVLGWDGSSVEFRGSILRLPRVFVFFGPL